MAIYSIGANTTVTTTGAACADCRAGAANSPRIMEVGINLAAATASTYGLIRTSNTPTQTSPVLLQAENPGDPAATTGVAVAWSVAPTIGSVHLRRIALPATIGTGIIWTFPRGLVIAAAGTIVIWNLATNANNMNFWFVSDE